MKRRLLLTVASGLALGGAAWASPDAHGRPGYKVSAEQLQLAVARRFPLRYPLGGLLDLNVQAPRLRLLPALNRLGTEMVVQANGPALGRSYTGTFDLDFALRYEASDRSIRAHQLRVNSLRFAGLPPGPSELLNAYVPALAEQTLREVVLHQLRPQDLALPDGLGLQPDSITVTPQGLVIGFVAKPTL
ncbi:MAG: DUF1439 domain-containing protein [Polaromonas sp.]|nr:DUF1439 domain-containing protein [Polaromonas sp.]